MEQLQRIAGRKHIAICIVIGGSSYTFGKAARRTGPILAEQQVSRLDPQSKALFVFCLENA